MSDSARRPWDAALGGTVLVAVLALLVRLLPLPVIAHRLTTVDAAGFAEDGPLFYLPLAHSIAERGEFAFTPGAPTPHHVPLYPLLLAGLLRIGMAGPLGVAFVQSFLGAIAVALVFAWVRVMSGTGPALIAAAWASFLPDFAAYSYLNMSENLSIVFILAALLSFEKAMRNDGLRLWAVAGAFVGLAGLTREYGITLLLPLACAAAGRVGVARSTGRIAVMAGTALLVILPWIARNYIVFGEFIPLSAKGGLNVYVGTLTGKYHLSDPRRNWSFEDARQAQVAEQLKRDLAGTTSPTQKNRIYLRAAWENVRGDVWGQIRYLGRKAGFFWQANLGIRHRERAGLGPILVVSEVAYALCLLSAVCVFFVRRRAPLPLGTLALLTGWTFLFHVIVGEAESRYHFALLPAVFACAGVTLAALSRALTARLLPGPAGGCAA